MSSNKMVYSGGPSQASMNRTPGANAAPVGVSNSSGNHNHSYGGGHSSGARHTNTGVSHSSQGGGSSGASGYNAPAAPQSQSYDSHVQRSHQSTNYQPQMSPQDSKNLFDVRPQTRQPEVYGQTAIPQMMGQFYALRKMQNPWGF